MSSLRTTPLPPGSRAMRERIRAFLDSVDFAPQVDSWGSAFDAEFSAALGSAGFLGLTWPRRYGGHERSAFDRLVVNEELLARGAPVAAHWFADRQVGPALLRHGSLEQKQSFLPRMAAGTCFAAIGLSEPGAGSDLAAVRTRAREVAGGWILSGQKIWTSWAHRSHFIVVLARTSAPTEDRHAGLSQLIVELPDPGVSIRPIAQTSGEAHFNEVFFDEVFVPEHRVLGAIGSGWSQITGELAHERSGAERFLSPMPLLLDLEASLADGPAPDPALTDLLTRSTARLRLLRQASVQIAAQLEEGESPEVQAACVKDLGTGFEQEFVAAALATTSAVPDRHSPEDLERHLGQAVLRSPTFTLRGGVNDILRSIVAKGTGLR